MPARLTLHYSDQPARTFIAEEAREYLLGRGPECDIVIDDARVSRRHARLSVFEAGARIVDLGSKNGLEVDGLAAGGGNLGASHWLSLGGLLVQIECGADVRDQEEVEAGRRRATLAEHLALAQQDVGGATLVHRLLESYLQISGTDRGFVLLAGGQGRFHVVASSGLTPESLTSPDFSGSASTVEEVLAGGEAVIRSDAMLDPRAGSRPSIVREKIRALVCVPLLAAGQTIGAAYGDSRRPGTSFGELDVEILGALATHAALAIWAAGLKEEIGGLTGNLPTRVNSATPAVPPLQGFQPWTPRGTASVEGDRV